jgi:hypothetical protein
MMIEKVKEIILTLRKYFQLLLVYKFTYLYTINKLYLKMIRVMLFIYVQDL